VGKKAYYTKKGFTRIAGRIVEEYNENQYTEKNRFLPLLHKKISGEKEKEEKKKREIDKK